MTMIVVTHETMSFAREVADRVAVMVRRPDRRGAARRKWSCRDPKDPRARAFLGRALATEEPRRHWGRSLAAWLVAVDLPAGVR